MLSDAQNAASAADAMQAEYFRGFLDRQQSALTDQLASLTRRLTACMTRGETTTISHMRRAIRGVEAEMHAIDRMAHALAQRFPEDPDVRRRALPARI